MSTRGKKGWIIAFTLPCVILFCLVYAIPFIMVITTSFCDYTLTQAPVFKGIGNFKTIFADPVRKSCLCDSEYYTDCSNCGNVLIAFESFLWCCENDLRKTRHEYITGIESFWKFQIRIPDSDGDVGLLFRI